MLGNSIEKIAKEKAGVIKPKIPILIGRKQDRTKAIFDEIAQKSFQLYYAENCDIESDLKGIYQKENKNTTYSYQNFKKSCLGYSR